ncbi:MAG: DNA recombination protein RmuC [Acidimicrobiia bacterium]
MGVMGLVAVVLLAVVLLAAGGFAVFAVAERRRALGLEADWAAGIAAQGAELRRQSDAEREAVIREVLAANREVLEVERARGTAELDGKKAVIDERLASMDSTLGQVVSRFQTLEAERSRQYGELSAQLTDQRDGLASLLTTTQGLREALSSTKARGQWGERMAEDVLRLAGFLENVNYKKQRAVQGGRGIPDFTFFLPNELVLHMDVKFPLDNYIRSLEATSDLDEKRYREAYLRDVRARVKELKGRDYVDPGGGTVDFVLLFIPNEGVYAYIHEHDGTIVEDAVRSGVVFCSPLTLFSVLALIRQTCDNFQLARTSDQILTLLGEFVDQWGRFTGQMDKVGQRIEGVRKEFEALTGTRRRMLERPLDRIEALRQEQLPGCDAAEPEGERPPFLRALEA